MLTATVSFDVSETIAAYQGAAAVLAQGNENPEFRAGMEGAADIYSGFCREHFMDASNGNGMWPDITFQTKYERLRKAWGSYPGGRKAAKALAREPFSLPILYITGQKYDSLLPGVAYHVREIEQYAIEEGSDAPNIFFHQSGTRNMPARPPLVLPDEETMAEMSESIGEGLSKAIAAGVQ